MCTGTEESSSFHYFLSQYTGRFVIIFHIEKIVLTWVASEPIIGPPKLFEEANVTKKLFIFILMLASIAVQSKPVRCEVSGINGNYLSGIQIYLDGNLIGKTDENGLYYCKVKPGTHEFTFFSTDYRAVNRHILVSKGRNAAVSPHDNRSDTKRHRAKLRTGRKHTITLSVVMIPEVQEQIVVSALGVAAKVRNIPVKTEVISAEEIERKESNTLADALESTPGVRVEMNCQNCNFSQIRMQGLQGGYSQILVDQAPVITSLASVYGIEQIPVDMIERLEIVKGGGSSVYGSGAIAGVVNVITKTPDRTGGEIRFGQSYYSGTSVATPFDKFDSSVSYTNIGGHFSLVDKNSNNSVIVFFNRADRDPLDMDGDGFTELARLKNRSFGLSYFTMVGGTGFRFDYTRIEEERRGGNRLDFLPEEADICEMTDITRTGMHGSIKHQFSDDWDLSLDMSYAGTERNSYYGGGQDPNAYGETKDPLTVILGKSTYSGWKSHQITVGGEWTREHLVDVNVGYDRLIENKYIEQSLFVEDLYKFNEKVSIVYGFRLSDHSELDDYIFSPRFSILYHLNDEWELRTTLTTGYKPPLVFDEDLHITIAGGEGQVIRNSDDLKEESSKSISFDLRFRRNSFDRSFLFSATAFYHKIDDIHQIVENDDPATPNQVEFYRVNGSSADVCGVELTGTARLGSLQLDAGYTILHTHLAESEPDFGSSEFFRTPSSYGYLTALWDLSYQMQIVGSLNYTGSMNVPHYAGFISENVLESTDSFLTLDLKVARDFKIFDQQFLTVSLGLKNITDDYQDDFDQGPDRDSGYVYGPRFPRTVYASIRYKF